MILYYSGSSMDQERATKWDFSDCEMKINKMELDIRRIGEWLIR